MGIWNAVENLGQTIIDTASEAIDTTVAFVNDLPPPDSILSEANECQLPFVDGTSQELIDECQRRHNESFRNISFHSFTYEPDQEIIRAVNEFLKVYNQESFSDSAFDGVTASGVVNVAEESPWWDPIGITDMEACIPIVDGDCMDDPEEWAAAGLLVAGTAAAVAGGVAIVGAVGTTTVVTAAAPIVPAAGLVLTENPGLQESVKRFLSSNLSERVAENIILKMANILGL